MGISNISSNLRAGICTSTTRPTTPYEGQVIYETDTNRVLVYDNAAWVMIADTDQPPGLQLVKTQTVGTGVSSVTVSDAFSADYDNYKITYTGGSSSNPNTINLQLGSTTTGYYAAYNAVLFNGATASFSSTNNGTSFERVAFGNGADSVGLSCDVLMPYLNNQTYIQSFASSATRSGSTSGYLTNTTSYTEFTLVVNSGTITGGTIRVYGYRNS